MRQPGIILLPFFAGMLLIACSEDDPVTPENPTVLQADQQYYPLLRGSEWQYRFDTTGTDGMPMTGVYLQTSRIEGTREIDGIVYTVQVNETDNGTDVFTDSLFFRKTGEGLYATTATLRFASLFPGLPNLPIDIPEEIAILQYPLETVRDWMIFEFEFRPIPFFAYYFRIEALNRGTETYQGEWKTYYDCRKIRITADAVLPNPEDPTNFLDPLVINETADFWFLPTGGLVAGDGSALIFALLQGRGELTFSQATVHQELLGMNIVQPADTCGVIAAR